jgi:predicted nucleic acid-binding protein
VVIFLDANVLLRTFVEPDTAQSRRSSQIAAELLRRAGLGEAEFTTSDAVLAEVAFILTARTHANLPISTAAGLVASVVKLRGFRHDNKNTILHTLDFWADHPRLGFVDALTAAYARLPGMRLATIDSDFDGLPGIDRWRPGESS